MVADNLSLNVLGVREGKVYRNRQGFMHGLCHLC